MDEARRVLRAAEDRAAALAAADREKLTELLHPEFHWTSHRGERFDRDGYIESNTSDATRWRSQTLIDPRVNVVGDSAVLACTTEDVVLVAGWYRALRMPMTQFWVRVEDLWTCVAGHAGPLLPT